MKKLFKTMLFLSLLAGVSIILNDVTLNRRSEGCIQLADFYELEEDQVDVLCIGSSHVYYGINTCLLYDRYGIASYLLASPGQPVWISYYLLEEALKTQHPRLTVLDIGTMYRKEDDFGAYSFETLISMKPSRTKWNAIAAVNQYGEILDAPGAFFSFPYYHTRSFTLTSEDFNNTDEIRYLGYKPDFTRISEKELAKWEKEQDRELDESPVCGEESTITERTEHYLRKFIELCQEKKIPLLLVNAPFANQVEEKRNADAYIQTIAEEYDVPLIEGNKYKEEMQIDFAEDLLDASHLNYFGSVKYTNYLADWMKGNIILPDCRNDTQYDTWAQTSELFQRQELNARMLQEIQSKDDYLETLKQQPDSVTAICWQQNQKLQIWNSGKCVFQESSDRDYFKHLNLGTSDLAVRCTDGRTTVLLDQQKYSFVEEGINILVYDQIAGRVIDGVGFEENGRMDAVR